MSVNSLSKLRHTRIQAINRIIKRWLAFDGIHLQSLEICYKKQQQWNRVNNEKGVIELNLKTKYEEVLIRKSRHLTCHQCKKKDVFIIWIHNNSEHLFSIYSSLLSDSIESKRTILIYFSGFFFNFLTNGSMVANCKKISSFEVSRPETIFISSLEFLHT